MILLKFYFFFLGTVMGSFCNALSYRLPNNISIITPRSRCPKCGHQLSWFENIPLISFLIQKGRCRYCYTVIPIRYLITEIVFGFGYLFFYNNIIFLSFSFFLSILLFSIFVLIIIIDIEKQIIPDSLNISLAFMLPLYTKNYLDFKGLILGGLIGFFLPYCITFLYYKISGKIGLGGGDIKLFGAIGLGLGLVGFINNLFLSCSLGSLIIIILIIIKKINRNNPVPFGPFIIIILFIQLFIPEYITFIMRELF